jgi:hypothetical protein
MLIRLAQHGWGLHRLESAAFARRTPHSDIGPEHFRMDDASIGLSSFWRRVFPLAAGTVQYSVLAALAVARRGCAILRDYDNAYGITTMPL